MEVAVHDLELAYGDFVAIKSLDLIIPDGESVVLLGQSGCGKTSTMRCIAGLEMPTGGTISIGDKTVFDGNSGKVVPVYKRNVGMVFQSYAVWPHKTVLENVASLKRHALVVCLWASPEAIWRRVHHQSHRPLLHDKDPMAKIRQLLAEREPVYRAADVLVNTELRSVREVVQQVVHQFRLAQGGSHRETGHPNNRA